MKKLIIFFCCGLHLLSGAQEPTTPGSVNSEVKIKELAVPKAPAFKLLDISPTQIETPTNPKQFALGVAQSFGDSIGWPQNYSMELTPYWWLKSSNKSVYDFLGLRTVTDDKNRKKVTSENLFSGLKFTSISLAFVNQDLIPDSVTQAQKIFSIGIHSTVIKIHSKNYAKKLETELKKWHEAAQKELEFALTDQPSDTDKVAYEAYWQRFTDMKPTTTGEIFDKINDIINEKPLFNLDVAAAYANYGIDNEVWKTGRAGIWTTFSTYLPLKFNEEDNVDKNYVAIFGYFRYLQDNYAVGKNNEILKSSCADIGAKVELQFDKLSVGFETIHRNYSKSDINSASRNVGVISYQLGSNIYINGAFGKDFGLTNKLISFLGINWGFGNEKTKLE